MDQSMDGVHACIRPPRAGAAAVTPPPFPYGAGPAPSRPVSWGKVARPGAAATSNAVTGNETHMFAFIVRRVAQALLVMFIITHARDGGRIRVRQGAGGPARKAGPERPVPGPVGALHQERPAGRSRHLVLLPQARAGRDPFQGPGHAGTGLRGPVHHCADLRAGGRVFRVPPAFGALAPVHGHQHRGGFGAGVPDGHLHDLHLFGAPRLAALVRARQPGGDISGVDIGADHLVQLQAHHPAVHRPVVHHAAAVHPADPRRDEGSAGDGVREIRAGQGPARMARGDGARLQEHPRPRACPNGAW